MMKAKLLDVVDDVFAGGDVPKDRFSEVMTDRYRVPVYANAEKEDGLYGYTDMARVFVPCVTVAARGTIGFTAKRREPFLPVVRLITVVPDKGKITLDYLYYALRNYKPKSRGTSIPQLTVPDIKEYSFEIVPISIQERITRILDKVERLMERQREQIEGYNLLMKARFVEMFGDPLLADESYPRYAGKELFVFSSGKFLPDVKRIENGYPVYGGNGIAWHTDEPLIEHDTIVVGRVGAYCGNVHLIKEPAWITDNAIYIKKFKQGIFDIDFLYYLMHMLDFCRYADFSGQPKITQKPLETLKYVAPPMKLQKQFAAFVRQTDKLKAATQKALKETQLLFDSLMQQYFG